MLAAFLVHLQLVRSEGSCSAEGLLAITAFVRAVFLVHPFDVHFQMRRSLETLPAMGTYMVP